MSIYCKARNCGHPTTHNIYAHQCNQCGKYGHGISECDPLFSCGVEIVDIPVEKQCTISTCKHQTTHTNDGHQCRLCFRYGHGYGECTIAEPSKILETFPVKDVENFYIKKYTGMGCYLYVKYENMAKCTGTFSMNGDDWSQYGVTKVPELKDFLSGYQPLREVDTI